MNPSNEHPGNVAALLGHIRNRGVRLWLENGQLRYRAPKGALGPSELEALSRSKQEILSVLHQAALAESPKPRIATRSSAERAPLSYSQLSHWYQYELWRQPSHRQIATAIRLRGPLDEQALRQGVAEVIRAQEALRTRVVIEDGGPVQSISASNIGGVCMEDLRSFSAEDQSAELTRRIEACILEPVDLAVDPLFGVHLLRLSEHEHVLVLSLEHTISDMYSLNILRRDVFSAYAQVLSGRPVSLPHLPVRFADYASWQRHNEPAWRALHERYWKDRLRGVAPVHFPRDVLSSQDGTLSGWSTVTFSIDLALKSQLGAWAQRHATTLVMAVFTAYVALLLRWSGQREGIIRYQTDGRTDADWQNTIGYFALPLFLRVHLRESDCFPDLLERVVGEYCDALQHADYCYLEAQLPKPGFARSSAFNWWPPQSDGELQPNTGSPSTLACSDVPFVHPLLRTLLLDAEPAVVFAELPDGIRGELHYPQAHCSRASMQRFAGALRTFIRALLREPNERIADLALPN